VITCLKTSKALQVESYTFGGVIKFWLLFFYGDVFVNLPI
jgi:hypothetical protein